MDFFHPIVEKSRQNKNFTSILQPFRKAERELFNIWANGFIDRDGKIIKEFQTTFNSAFWEVYLYASFKEYGFSIDWSHASPDFCINGNGLEFVVEATIANSAIGKPNEWDRNYSLEELNALREFRSLNTEAIIRLSNAILSKVRKYQRDYKNKSQVKGKPFVLAVAPFEQPHFNLQYNRPIRALLYDYYVDEDAYINNPDAYPNGPPVINLGHVEKNNGAEIPLGIFDDSGIPEVSAIIFSCTATWGKLTAMSKNPAKKSIIDSVWATFPDGAPERRTCELSEYDENILDGLQIYHNPYAEYPLRPEIFRRSRVVQHYLDRQTYEWVYEGSTDALQFRSVSSFIKSESGF